MMVAWFTLNLLDVLLTLGIVKLGGQEVMPVASWMLAQGTLFFVLGRFVLTTFAAFILDKMRWYVFGLVLLGMVAVVAWNLASVVSMLKVVG